MKIIALFCKGLLVGVADLLPGVSGGTMALLTGIYGNLLSSLARLQHAVALFLRGRLRQATEEINWFFFLPLGAGILVSIISFSHLIGWLLENYHDWVLAFFLGLVLATAHTLYMALRQQQHPLLFSGLFFLAGLLLSLGIEYVQPFQQPSLLAYFFAGALAICAMILPGISGSLLLLLLGMYQPLLQSLRAFDLPVIALFGCGAFLGLLLFSRALHFLYYTYRAACLAFLCGLTLGSARALLPHEAGQYTNQSLYWIILCALVATGILCGWLLAKVGGNDESI